MFRKLNEDLPTREVDKKKFPNPESNTDDFFERGQKDGNKHDDKIKTYTVSIPAKDLLPSQDAIYLGKTIGLAVNGVEGGNLGAVISKDNRILDGHHRWAATIFNNSDTSITGEKCDLIIGDLVLVLRAAGDALGNPRGVEPSGGDLNIFKSSIKDIHDCVYLGKHMDKKFYNKEKAIAWYEAKGEENLIKSLDLIKKNPPPKGAPARKNMPKIEPSQVDKVATDLKQGNIDAKKPYISEKYVMGFDSFINEAKAASGKSPDIYYSSSCLTPKATKKLEVFNSNSLKELANLKLSGLNDTYSMYGMYHGSRYPEFFATIVDNIKSAEDGFTYWENADVQFNTSDGIPLVVKISIDKKFNTFEFDGTTIQVGTDYLRKLYYVNDNDIIKVYTQILTQVFDKYKNEISDKIAALKKVLKAYVLSIGNVSIKTGKTQYGWSIYDSPGSEVFLVRAHGGFLLYATPDSFKIGDVVHLYGNDNNRNLSKTGPIIDSAKCTQAEVTAMLLKNGYDYRDLGPYKKKKFSDKLGVSYSVKGTEYLHGGK